MTIYVSSSSSCAGLHRWLLNCRVQTDYCKFNYNAYPQKLFLIPMALKTTSMKMLQISILHSAVTTKTALLCYLIAGNLVLIHFTPPPIHPLQDSPTSKLLYNKEVQAYKTKVKK